MRGQDNGNHGFSVYMEEYMFPNSIQEGKYNYMNPVTLGAVS